MNGAKLISRNLDTVGNGTGTTNAIGDYSSAAEEFKIAPGVGEHFHIHRLIVSIGDAGSFDSGGYGAVTPVASLTNGVVLRVQNGGTVFSLTDDPITTNAEWAAYCHDVTVHSFGSGDALLTARWTFDKSGIPISLRGDEGEELVVELNDDLTFLTAHKFLIQGYYKSGGGY